MKFKAKDAKETLQTLLQCWL